MFRTFFGVCFLFVLLFFPGYGLPVGPCGQFVARMAYCGIGATTLPGAKLRWIWQSVCLGSVWLSLDLQV